MAYYEDDLSAEAKAFLAEERLAGARMAGATPAQLDAMRRLLSRLYRRKRAAAGLCLECGGKLDGHWCQPATQEWLKP